jgi:hypothetical protein
MNRRCCVGCGSGWGWPAADGGAGVRQLHAGRCEERPGLKGGEGGRADGRADVAVADVAVADVAVAAAVLPRLQRAASVGRHAQYRSTLVLMSTLSTPQVRQHSRTA